MTVPMSLSNVSKTIGMLRLCMRTMGPTLHKNISLLCGIEVNDLIHTEMRARGPFGATPNEVRKLGRLRTASNSKHPNLCSFQR